MRQLAPRLRRETSPAGVVQLFRSDVAEITQEPEPIQLRLTLYVLVSVFVVALAITVFTKMNRVVTSTLGVIVTTEPTIILEALDPSIIKSINIRDGDRVKAGQVLGALDPTLAEADVVSLKLQLASFDAEIARCVAELHQKPFTPPKSSLPGADKYASLQQSYYDQRKAQFDAQMRAYNEQIDQVKATMAQLQTDEERYADRESVANDIQKMREQLNVDRVGSRLDLLMATDQRLEIERNLEFDRNGILEDEHQLKAAVANRDAFVQQWYSQISQELLTARNGRDAAREELAKALKHRSLVLLQAPQDALVLKLEKLSVGSVLKEGDLFASLAPTRSPIEAEVHIAAMDVGFVRVGDAAAIKLDAFNFVEHGLAEGKVREISDGSFTLDDNGNTVDPYYKARIVFTKVKLRNVPTDFCLVPGMMLTADIQVGTRSVFVYLVRGLVRGISEAMREP
jgi:hemolysin D